MAADSSSSEDEEYDDSTTSTALVRPNLSLEAATMVMKPFLPSELATDEYFVSFAATQAIYRGMQGREFADFVMTAYEERKREREKEREERERERESEERGARTRTRERGARTRTRTRARPHSRTRYSSRGGNRFRCGFRCAVRIRVWRANQRDPLLCGPRER